MLVVFDLPYFDLIRAMSQGASIFVEAPGGGWHELRGEVPHVSNPDEARGSLGISPPPAFEIVEGARVELRNAG
jgi:hypothetical protein